MKAALVLVAALALTGCATNVTTGGASVSPSPTQQPPSPEPPPEPQETSPQPNNPTPSATENTQPCEEVMFQRAQGTIRSQQRAFADGNFEAARAYASDSFRDSVTVDSFQGIIEGTYAFLLDDPGLDFVDCQRQGNSALIQVEVAGSPIVVMVYRMVLENESWFIDAASVAGSREAVTA